MLSLISYCSTTRREPSSLNGGILTIIAMVSSLLTSSVAASGCIQQSLPPQLRYPPYPLKPANSTNNFHVTAVRSWTSPQPQNLYGTYFITHSSRPSYLNLTNLRGEHYPVFPQTTPSFPPGSEVDIVSWSSSATNTSSKAITTVFGWFKPLSLTGSIANDNSNTTRTIKATWSYSSTGILINTTNLYAILGYGTDRTGHAYRIDYETGYFAPGASITNAQPCINIASRVESGPDEITYDEITAALRVVGYEYGDDGFVGLVSGLKRLMVDGRRTDEGPVTCDEACTQNTDLVPRR